MKKLVLIVCIVVAGFSAFILNKSKSKSKVTLENIEALGESEYECEDYEGICVLVDGESIFYYRGVSTEFDD